MQFIGNASARQLHRTEIQRRRMSRQSRQRESARAETSHPPTFARRLSRLFIAAVRRAARFPDVLVEFANG
jgi:hypothetical protein